MDCKSAGLRVVFLRVRPVSTQKICILKPIRFNLELENKKIITFELRFIHSALMFLLQTIKGVSVCLSVRQIGLEEGKEGTLS